jgi:hypothetical protein
MNAVFSTKDKLRVIAVSRCWALNVSEPMNFIGVLIAKIPLGRKTQVNQMNQSD